MRNIKNVRTCSPVNDICNYLYAGVPSSISSVGMSAADARQYIVQAMNENIYSQNSGKSLLSSAQVPFFSHFL